jgi:hypothetical protein
MESVSWWHWLLHLFGDVIPFLGTKCKHWETRWGSGFFSFVNEIFIFLG